MSLCAILSVASAIFVGVQPGLHLQGARSMHGALGTWPHGAHPWSSQAICSGWGDDAGKA